MELSALQIFVLRLCVVASVFTLVMSIFLVAVKHNVFSIKTIITWVYALAAGWFWWDFLMTLNGGW